MSKPNDNELIYWDDITPEEREYLIAYKNTAPARQRVVKLIVELFYVGKNQEAMTLLANDSTN